MIDIVIPLAEKDVSTIQRVIKGLENIENKRNIYVVCSSNLQKYVSDYFIDEKIFPFTKNDIQSSIFGNNSPPSSRGPGWYFQQLLKLYAYKVIPGISDTILIVDSETIFYNPYTPLENNKTIFALSNEINESYRKHMKNVLPEITIKYPNISSICHQMMFQKDVLDVLFSKVEKSFKDRFGKDMQFWQIMCYFGKDNWYSEYDIYFNFMITFFEDRVILGKTRWDISSTIPDYSDYTYLTCHSHIRNSFVAKDQYLIKQH